MELQNFSGVPETEVKKLARDGDKSMKRREIVKRVERLEAMVIN